VETRLMPDAYDTKAAELDRQHGYTRLHVAAMARESVREAMVDLAAKMCPECRRGHTPKAADCGKWFEHRHVDYETGCTASHVWDWLNSK
jgi:hypothetical protein